MWIEKVLEEVNKIDLEKEDGLSTLGELMPNEDPIAELPIKTQRLSIYLEKIYAEILAKHKAAKETDSKRLTTAITEEADALIKQYEVLRQILWLEVRKTCEGIPGSKGELGLRKGWLIVKTYNDKTPAGKA